MHRPSRSSGRKRLTARLAPRVPDELAAEAARDPFSDGLPFHAAFPLRFWDIVLEDVATRLAPYPWACEPPRGLAWVAQEVRERIRQSAQLHLLAHPDKKYGEDIHFVIAALLEYFRDTTRARDSRRSTLPSHDRRHRLRRRTGRQTGTVSVARARGPLDGFAETVQLDRLVGGHPSLEAHEPKASPQIFGRLLTDYLRERPGSRRGGDDRRYDYRGWTLIANLLNDFWGGLSSPAIGGKKPGDSLRRLVRHAQCRFTPATMATVREYIEATSAAILSDHRRFFRLP